MNQNNSSSAYTDELLSISEYDTKLGGDLQKLKCENFQLRLMCYNYENTLSELECDPNDENEVGVLKKSYCNKVEMVNNLEETVQRIQKENCCLRKELQEYNDFNNSSVKFSKDDETQVNLECLECKGNKLMSKRQLSNLSLQVKCLENVNLDLQSTLKDIGKPDTSEIGCCTEKVFTTTMKSVTNNETDIISDIESDTSQSKPLKSMNLKVIFEKTMKSLSKFINSYNEGEIQLADLEKELMATLKLESNNASIIDEKYKINLFKEGTYTWEMKCLDDIMQKCQSKIIDDDVSELISYNDDNVEQQSPNVQPSIENPNILAIKSVVDKLNENSNEKKLIRNKIKYNKDWKKNITKKSLSINETTPLKSLTEEFDIHIEKLTDIMSSYTKFIPFMQLSFNKTINQLTDMKPMLDNETIKKSPDYYQKFVKNYHEKNKKIFVEKCNLFIQTLSDCILSLNKEKVFLNHTPEIFNSMSNYEIDNDNNYEVEIIEDTKLIESDQQFDIDDTLLHLTNKNNTKINRSEEDIISHVDSNVDNGDNEIQIDVTDFEIQNYDNDNDKCKILNQRDFGISYELNTLKKHDSQTQSDTNLQFPLSTLDCCVFVNKLITNRNSETQTDQYEFNNQNQNLNKSTMKNKLEVNVNLYDMENTSVITSSDKDEKTEKDYQDLIAYSNQSNKTYNIREDLKLPFENHNKILHEYLAEYIKDFSYKTLRRSFSLGTEIYSDHITDQNDEFHSIPNLNSNNKIPADFGKHLSNLVGHSNSHDTSITINNFHKPDLKINQSESNIYPRKHEIKRLANNQMNLFSFQNVSEETSGLLLNFKLRMIKLLFIHDLRKNLNSISKKDIFVTTELMKIINNFRNLKSQSAVNDSQLFIEIQHNINQWHHQAESFKNYSNDILKIPKILLNISDEELINYSFINGESKLDFPITIGDKFVNDSEIFSYVESLIVKLQQKYSNLNQLYLKIIEKKQQIFYQFTDEFQKTTEEFEKTLQLKYVQLETENEKLKYQYQTSLIEKERVESQNENYKTKTKNRYNDLIKEKQILQMEFEKITVEKSELSKWIDDKLSEEKERELINEQEFTEKINELNELKNEFTVILDQNRQLNNKIKNLQIEIDSQNEDKYQLNEIINQSKSELMKMNVNCQQMEEEINNLRQHEKQLLVDNNRLEKSIENQKFDIENLCGNIEIYKNQLKEFDNQINVAEKNYLNKIEELDKTIEKLQKESIQLKEKIFVLNDDNNKLSINFNNEKRKLMEINESYQALEKQFKSYKELQESVNVDYKGKIKTYLNDLYHKMIYLTDAMNEFLSKIHSVKNKTGWKNEFDFSIDFNDEDCEDLKQLKIINNNINVLLEIIEKEISKARTHEEYGIDKIDKLISPLNGDLITHIPNKNTTTKKKSRYIVEKRSKLERVIFPFHDNYEIINDLNVEKKALKIKPEICRRRTPIPTPRFCSKQLKDAFNLNQKNKNNSEIDNKNNSELSRDIINEETISVITDSSMSLSIDSNQGEDIDKSIISNDKINTSEFSGVTFQRDFTNNNSINSMDNSNNSEYKQKMTDTVNFFLTMLTDETDSEIGSKLNKKDWNELKNVLNSLELKSENNQVNLSQSKLSSNLSNIYDTKNIDSLLKTNHDLSENLIKATNKILEIQNKLESVNAELCQCQIAKHEKSVELASKLEKISKLQSMLNKYQTISCKSKSIVQATQTNNQEITNTKKEQRKNYEIQSENIEVKHSYNKSRKHSKANGDLDSRDSNSTIINYKETCQQSTQENSKSNSLIKINVDGNWDDVTRTMIRCLTTLSEVQESLVTPPLITDTSSSIPESFSPLNNRDGTSNHAYETNTERKTVVIAIIKEKKYQLIRELISNIKAELNDQELQEAPIHINGILPVEGIKKPLKKLNYIINNCFKIRKLNVEQWLMLTGKSDSNSHKSLDINENFLRNPLNVTNKVHIDIVRLQQRLERYQTRYKSLKHAVMTNKYKLIETSKDNLNEY